MQGSRGGEFYTVTRVDGPMFVTLDPPPVAKRGPVP